VALSAFLIAKSHHWDNPTDGPSLVTRTQVTRSLKGMSCAMSRLVETMIIGSHHLGYIVAQEPQQTAKSRHWDTIQQWWLALVLA
jgi:hypothetical protein